MDRLSKHPSRPTQIAASASWKVEHQMAMENEKRSKIKADRTTDTNLWEMTT
jgi:hypothetical protein